MNLSRRTTLISLACLPLLSAPSLLLARSKFKDRDPVDFGRRAPSSFPVHGIDAARFQGQMRLATGQSARCQICLAQSDRRR